MDINITAQKGMRTFVLVAIIGVGVFLTVSAVQYGYQVWTRADDVSEPLTPAEDFAIPTAAPLAGESSFSEPSESLFEPLVEEEGGTYNIMDVAAFVDAYGTDDPEFDLNEDGIVDEDDFEIFKRSYE